MTARPQVELPELPAWLSKAQKVIADSDWIADQMHAYARQAIAESEARAVGDYLLFAGHYYYPEGGADDLRARGTVEELKAYFRENANEISGQSYIDNWGQIVEAATLKCVLRGCVRHIGDYRTPGESLWEPVAQEAERGEQ